MGNDEGTGANAYPIAMQLIVQDRNGSLYIVQGQDGNLDTIFVTQAWGS